MRIIIVGCGKVGSELAGQLSAAGHDLTLVDLSERRLEELSNTHDLATVKGSGTSYHVLREAGVQDTDLLIAVTAHDEINLLSCLIQGIKGMEEFFLGAFFSSNKLNVIYQEDICLAIFVMKFFGGFSTNSSN